MIRTRLALSTLFICAAFVMPARASLDETRFSDNERVGFAFARLSGARPDFEGWITSGEGYRGTAESDRPLLLQSELARLRDGMKDYDPKIDLIHLMSRVTVKWNPADAAVPGGHSISVVFKPPGALFTYRLGDQRIDVVAEQIENPVSFHLQEEDYKEFLRVAGAGGAADVALELYLQPMAADAAPLTVQGEQVLPLIARVAHLALWSPDHQTIYWSFDAPWFTGSDRRKLLDLYDR